MEVRNCSINLISKLFSFFFLDGQVNYEGKRLSACLFCVAEMSLDYFRIRNNDDVEINSGLIFLLSFFLIYFARTRTHPSCHIDKSDG